MDTNEDTFLEEDSSLGARLMDVTGLRAERNICFLFPLTPVAALAEGARFAG